MFYRVCWARYHFPASAPLPGGRDKNSGELKIHPGAEKMLHVSASEEGWARALAWWSQGLHKRGEEQDTGWYKTWRLMIIFQPPAPV